MWFARGKALLQYKAHPPPPPSHLSTAGAKDAVAQQDPGSGSANPLIPPPPQGCAGALGTPRSMLGLRAQPVARRRGRRAAEEPRTLGPGWPEEPSDGELVFPGGPAPAGPKTRGCLPRARGAMEPGKVGVPPQGPARARAPPGLGDRGDRVSSLACTEPQRAAGRVPGPGLSFADPVCWSL